MAGMSWFVSMMQALASGDATSFMVYENPMDVREISRVLRTLEDAGMTRYSRKLWITVDHPKLGVLQWKRHFGGGAADVLFLRINGKWVLKAMPTPGSPDTTCEWVAKGASTYDQVQDVEHLLGSLQSGTFMLMRTTLK